MSMRHVVRCALGLALLLGCVRHSQAVPTLVNPSFEADSFPTFPGYSSVNGPITGWTVTGANRVGINDMAGPFASGFPIPDGTQTAFVQNAIGATGTLSQQITGLTPGEQYTVTFRTNGRNQGTRPLLETTLGDYRSLHSIAPSGLQYGFVEFGFTAEDTTATLAFANVNDGPDSTVLIDAVRVTEGAPPISGVGVQATSNLGGGFDRHARHLVDRNGLDFNGVGSHSNVLEGVHWLSTGTFQAPNDPDPEVVFDLGDTHDIGSIRIWNYNETAAVDLTTRGVRDFNLLVSDFATGPFTPVGTFTLDRSPGVTNVDYSQSFDISQRARFVMIDPINTHGADNNFFGLSEVQLSGTQFKDDHFLVKGVTIADVSSNLAGFNRAAQYLVDASGWFNGTHTVAPDGFMWLNQGTFGNVPADQFDTEPELTFDLGEVRFVKDVKIWNYNEFLPGRPDLLQRGVNEFEIFIGDDLGGPYTSLGMFNLDMAPGVENVDFSQTFTVNAIGRYVRLDLISNHGGDNNFFGLSEVQFFASVPEPATGTLGVLAVAALMWRRRRSGNQRQ